VVSASVICLSSHLDELGVIPVACWSLGTETATTPSGLFVRVNNGGKPQMVAGLMRRSPQTPCRCTGRAPPLASRHAPYRRRDPANGSPLRRASGRGCLRPDSADVRGRSGAVVESPNFVSYDVEIRRVIYSIESLNARYRRAIRARGHFLTEQAALKCPYLVTRSLVPTGRGKARRAMRWKPALNAFAITFNGR
jgi:hypothetical protein